MSLITYNPLNPADSVTQVRMAVYMAKEPELFKSLLTQEVVFNWQGLHKATKMGDIQLRYHRKFKDLLGSKANDFLASHASSLGLQMMSGPNNALYIVPKGAWDEVKEQLYQSTLDDPDVNYGERYGIIQTQYFGATW